MSNLTAQTSFNKSKLLYEIKLWAKMRNSVVQHYHKTIPVPYRLLDLDRLE